MVCCSVKRWAAWFLLLLTVFLPLQPLFASAQADASLPACCRRNGAHHCMMFLMMQLAESGTQTFISPSPCQFWKVAAVPALVATVGFLLVSASRPTMVGDVVVAAPAFSFVRTARLRSTRAPPVSLFSIPVYQA